MIRAVLYDLDGTLLNLAPALRPARRAGLRELLGQPPSARAERVFMRIRERFALADYADVFRGVARELGLEPGGAVRAERAMFVEVGRRMRWYPGASATLRALRRRGLILGLISTGFVRYQAPKIRRFGLRRLLGPHILVSGALGAEAAKPSTLMFRTFLRRARVRADQTVMVGNLVDDVLGAHLAGLRAVLYGPGSQPYRARLGLERADAVLRRHRDLLPLLARW
jgi:FMN phosphatase YigB (HAD superfamily)